ncbi:MAG: hypothetical protein JRN07_04455 [Nitrososphaerota archaeon]|nr:hypothetical protein [Nitrososphaerota archaeon]
MIPLAALYGAGELNLIDLGDTTNLLAIVAALAVVDVVLFFLARATFRREEILTKWR